MWLGNSKTPVLSDVRNITIAWTGLVALVSYENKVRLLFSTVILVWWDFQTPPQLWRMEKIKIDDTATFKLTLHHAFMPDLEASADFAGPSYFGGKDDELVLCISKGIH